MAAIINSEYTFKEIDDLLKVYNEIIQMYDKSKHFIVTTQIRIGPPHNLKVNIFNKILLN